MITRVHRFHGHASLPSLYRQASTVRGAAMNLKYLPRRANQPYRLAVVVSRKVSKSAVVRNRIRRRIYEVVRGWEQSLSGSHDIAIIVYSDTGASVPFEELKRQLAEIFIKAGILEKGEHAIVKATGE